MRFVTWNMNALGRGATHEASWAWLLNDLNPDVALVQEAVLPPHLAGRGVGETMAELGRGYEWGSFVVVGEHSGLSLEKVKRKGVGTYIEPPALADSHPGATAVALIRRGDGSEFAAVSMYGLMDNTGGGRVRHATTSLHRMLSDLMPLFEADVPVVLAGDFKVTTQPMKGDAGGWWHAQHEAFFARLSALGLESVTAHEDFDRGEGCVGCTCQLSSACRHVRTHRYMNRADSTPYQDDWAFVSKALAGALLGGRALDTEEAWIRSDHCPITFDLDV
jgi:exonuclease III